MIQTGSNGSALYSVSIGTGQTSLLVQRVGDGSTTNAMGFDSLRNRLFAVAAPPSGSGQLPRMVIINGDGSFTFYRYLPALSGTSIYNTGDVDEQGHFWASYLGTTIVEIDTTTNTTLYAGSATPPYNLYDWAYVPTHGDNLWTVAADSNRVINLLRFDRTAHTWSAAGNFGTLIGGTTNIGKSQQASTSRLPLASNLPHLRTLLFF